MFLLNNKTLEYYSSKTELGRGNPCSAAAIAGIAAGAASLGSSIFSSAVNNHATVKANRESLAAQKEMQESQNQFNLEMWNRQNQYNSPSAQRTRFEEAGYNPFMMSGSVNSGIASTAPSASQQSAPSLQAANHTDLSQFQNFLSNVPVYFNQTAQTQANVQNLSADTSGKLLENAYNLASLQSRIDSAHYDSDFKKYTAEVAGRTINSTIQQVDLRNQQIASQTRLTDAQTSYQSIQNEIASKYSDTNAQQLILKTASEIANLHSQTANLDEKTLTEQTQQILNRASASKANIDASVVVRLANAKVALDKAQAKLVPSEIHLNQRNAYAANEKGKYEKFGQASGSIFGVSVSHPTDRSSHPNQKSADKHFIQYSSPGVYDPKTGYSNY